MDLSRSLPAAFFSLLKFCQCKRFQVAVLPAGTINEAFCQDLGRVNQRGMVLFHILQPWLHSNLKLRVPFILSSFLWHQILEFLQTFPKAGIQLQLQILEIQLEFLKQCIFHILVKFHFFSHWCGYRFRLYCGILFLSFRCSSSWWYISSWCYLRSLVDASHCNWS